MTHSNDKIGPLLDRWQASLEHHTCYLALDDAAYASVDEWPRHQRPARWVVLHARSRLAELRRIADSRRERGDAEFADALELMAFLANLVGAEHVERFIPLARGAAANAEPRVVSPTPPRVADAGPDPRPAAEAPRAAEPSPASRSARAPATTRPRAEKPPRPDRTASLVIADAARLLSWGREWPQLAGLIARMADRPPEPEVWTILRNHRSTIVARARRAPD